MHATSVYHEGERLVRQRVGEESPASRNARVIADRIVPGAMPVGGELLIGPTIRGDITSCGLGRGR